MSGGSFDYLYTRLETFDAISQYENMAEEMAQWPEAQRRLYELAKVLAQARTIHLELENVMHAVEWWKSCDYGPDRVTEAVDKWKAGKPVVSDL